VHLMSRGSSFGRFPVVVDIASSLLGEGAGQEIPVRP
jgi:hypothetical protein